MTVFRWFCSCLFMALALALGGCASPVRQAPVVTADGPPVASSVDPLAVPDAVPRVEPLRLAGPNKPYEVAGVRYVPMTLDEPLSESGLASWYGQKFHGRPTASGERYDMNAMTAAHPTMPIPSYARVHNPANGRDVIVRVNDRGPFVRGRIIDLSYTAAVKLGVAAGVAPVRVTRLTHADILALAPTAVQMGMAGMAGMAGDAPMVALPSAVSPQAALAVQPLREAPAVAFTQAARGFWLQLGAFARQEGAVSLRRDVAARADWLAPLLTLFADGRMHRVQAGPYASRSEAQVAVEQVRQALALTPVIVERR